MTAAQHIYRLAFYALVFGSGVMAQAGLSLPAIWLGGAACVAFGRGKLWVE